MNSSAIGDVYEESHRVLRAIATRLVGWDEAEDLVQDAFVSVLKGHTVFRGDAAPRTWVTRILLNAAIDQSRRMKRRAWRHVPLDGCTRIDVAGSARYRSAMDDRLSLLAAIAALSPRDRQLTVLYYLCGYSSVEIAQRLNAPNGTVKSRLFDVRRRLRDLMCLSARGTAINKPRRPTDTTKPLAIGTIDELTN